MEHLGGFLVLSIVLIVIPGPDTALVTRNALTGGRRSAVATSFGVSLGLCVWTLAASLGLAALLRASEPAFVALKIVGSCYLVYLGLRALRDAFVNRNGSNAGPRSAERRSSAAVSLRQGLLSDLGNPKIAVFFTSFLPQFTPAGHSAFVGLSLLGFVFSALTLAWLCGYGFVVSRVGDVLRRPRVQRCLEGVTGAVLVGFGVKLALEHRS